MRRFLALISLSLAPVLASCGGTASTVRSAPPAPTRPGPHARLHLGLGAESNAGAGTTVAVYPVRPTKYQLDAPLADLGATAAVRRLVPHEATESDVQRLAAALGIADGSVVRTTDGFTLSGSSASLSVTLSDDNTSVVYSRDGMMAGGSSSSGGAATPGVATGSTPGGAPVPATSSTIPSTTTTTPPAAVPDANAAETIARALLDRMGVLGSEQWAADVSISGGVAFACPAGMPCPQIPPVAYERTVSFHRVLDGVDVPGADWSVTLGAQGRVDSVAGTWATAQPAGSYPLLSTRDAFTELQTGKARSVGPQPMMALGAPNTASPAPSRPTAPVVVHITGVALGYATWEAFDGTKAHTDIVPTYRFQARATEGGPSYDREVLALDPAAFDIVNPPPPSRPVPVPEPAAPPTAAPTSTPAAPLTVAPAPTR